MGYDVKWPYRNLSYICFFSDKLTVNIFASDQGLHFLLTQSLYIPKIGNGPVHRQKVQIQIRCRISRTDAAVSDQRLHIILTQYSIKILTKVLKKSVHP